jgi:hypothetical protein
VIAFAPPLDQTPTFPTMLLVGTLVTVEAPRTVKLAKSEPNNGVADAGAEPQKALVTASARIDTDLSELALRALLA